MHVLIIGILKFSCFIHFREYKSDTDSVASDVSESVNSNFSVSVLSTNLHAAAETDLRKLLSHRLNKGSIYSDEGCMASVEVG